MPALTLLDVEPSDVLLFPRRQPSVAAVLGSTLRLINAYDGQVAFKVKATAPQDYVIKPSSGSIRKGDSKEVIISRKHDETAKPLPERLKDRFLIQAAAVITEEQKLLLHAADRGKAAGKVKFWESVGKADLQEKQLDIGWLPEDPNYVEAPAQPPPSAAAASSSAVDGGAEERRGGAEERHAPAKSKGAGGKVGNEDIDAILGKLSKPGANICKPSPPPPGSAPPPPGLTLEGAADGPGAEQSTGPATQRIPLALQVPERQSKYREDVVLRGHSRPVTFVCFDPSGSLLFTCGKDSVVIAWKCPGGEAVRQFDGHSGAVWGCSISLDAQHLLTCGADSKVILWEVGSATVVTQVQLPGVVRYVEWAPVLGGQRFVACSNKFRDKPAAVSMWAIGLTWDGTTQQDHPAGVLITRMIFAIEEPILPSAAKQVAWAGPRSDKLCSVHDTGEVLFWDAVTGELLSRLQAHTGPASMVAFPVDRRLMASVGRHDMQVKLWDLCDAVDNDTDEPAGCEEGGEQPEKGRSAMQVQLIQSYTSDRPLNCAVVRPGLTYEEASCLRRGCLVDFAVGGGQDARDVALVGSTSDAQFEPQLLKLGEIGMAGTEVQMQLSEMEAELGKGRRGHFGPIHTLAFSLDAAFVASGSEDGNVRLRDLRVVGTMSI